MSGITAKQFDVLCRPLNSSRVTQRSQGGKQLSYLEAYDVKAHLTRIFGFCNYDSETLEAYLIEKNDVTVGKNPGVPGWEVIWFARQRLTVKDQDGNVLATYTESAVGNAVGASGLGDLHDNAVKQAASDALKRCAINLGNQFGLSLYDKGGSRDVVKRPIITPEDYEAPAADLSPEQSKTLSESLGTPNASEAPGQPAKNDAPAVIRTPEDAARAAEELTAKREGRK